MGLEIASPTGYQGYVIRGAITLVSAIKVGVLDVWIITFQGDADDLIFCWSVPEREVIGSAHRLF